MVHLTVRENDNFSQFLEKSRIFILESRKAREKLNIENCPEKSKKNKNFLEKLGNIDRKTVAGEKS